MNEEFEKYNDRPISIAVRADASSLIGTGHIFRCLSLCDELRDRCRIVFVCRNAPGNLQSLLMRRGYDVRMIPDSPNEVEDAAATRSALADDEHFDWLLVDHYGLSAGWERAIRGVARRIAIIDDLADRQHDADLLIDYMRGRDDSASYDGLLPPAMTRLIGHDYVLLRREFFGTSPPMRDYSSVKRILVTLGGNDPSGATELVLAALRSKDFAHIGVDVTVGISNVRASALQRQAEMLPNVALHMQHDRVSDLMRGADLCIGAGGTTSWERCYMGLPTLAFVLAENQMEVVARLEQERVLKSLGDPSAMTVEALQNAIQIAIQNERWRKDCGRRGQALVDGAGVHRVITAMQKLVYQGSVEPK